MGAEVVPLFDEIDLMPKPRSTYSVEFEQFWSVAKAALQRNGKVIGKKATAAEFAKVHPRRASVEDLCGAARNYAAWCAGQTPPRLCKDPERFLKHGTWEDFVPDESVAVGPVWDARTALSGKIADEWSAIVKALYQQGIPRTYLEKLELASIDERDRPVLQAASSFIRQRVAAEFLPIIERAWGKQVVLR